MFPCSCDVEGYAFSSHERQQNTNMEIDKNLYEARQVIKKLGFGPAARQTPLGWVTKLLGHTVPLLSYKTTNDEEKVYFKTARMVDTFMLKILV